MADSLFSDEFASAAVAAKLGGTKIAIDTRGGWDFAKYPINVYRDRSGSYSTDFDARKNLAAIKAIFDGVKSGTTGVYYANANAAADTGNGLTVATAKKVARSAIALGEADASKTAILVFLLEGEYDRYLDFLLTSTAGGVAPSKPFALIGLGPTGAVKMGPFTPPTGANAVVFAQDNATDATGKTYKATRASTYRIFNKANLDAVYRKETPFAKLADAAAVAASSGQDVFAIVGNDIYVKRADGAAVTNANVRVVLGAASCAPGAVPCFIAGIDFYGGTAGTFQRNIATTNPAVALDCWFIGPGIEGASTGTLANCVTVDGACLTAFIRCGTAYPNTDHYNPHGNQGRCHQLIINPAGAIGYGTGSSAQFLTGHGDDTTETSTRTMAINCNVPGNVSAGGSRRFVGGSKLIEFAGISDSDRGDVAAGGFVISTGVMVNNTATAILYEHDVRNCIYALQADAGATIVRYGGGLGGGIVSGAGTFEDN